jgi:nucleoid-associated protein YgaU
MKTGIAGILVLPLAMMILVLPGCTSVQDYWVAPEDQPPAAVVPAQEDPSSGSVDQDPVRETRRQEETGPQGEEAAQREAEVRENARKQEEARLQREAAAQREAEARENARRQEEARLQREAAAQREAEARENARKQEEVRRLLEELEATHRQAEAEERARQEAENRRFSGSQTGADLKPRYYIVRPGDTFNSIAADPRIYNNRSEWFTLYQANRNKLDNPDNPNLLVPGMVIEIPSITGELREGTY